MKVLITGGTGFLGTATALRLKGLGHDVSVLGRNPRAGEALAKKGIGFHKTDLADQKGVLAATAGNETVIHCAALASPWGKYQNFYEANVVGTNHVLEACRHHRVRRLVNLSTPSLYFDFHHRFQIKETDPLPTVQATHYAATKLIADQAVRKAGEAGLETVGLRPRAIFGPGDKTVLGRLIQLAQKGTVPIVGGGHSFVDMTYIDNCVDAVVLAMNAPKISLGKTYNITNGEPLETREIMQRLYGELGLTVKYRNLPFWLVYTMAALTEAKANFTNSRTEPKLTKYTVGLMSRSQTLDISAARAELGYTPAVSMADGFKRFAEWWRTSQA